MTLTLGLGAAVSGLMTSQNGLDLISQNIANVNTPGYTRKEFNQVSRVLSGRGAGVEVGLPTREVDQGLMRSILKEGATLSGYQTLDQFYTRIQDLFGTPETNSSVAHIVSALGDELESLAVSPDKSTAQASAIDAAVRTAEKLNSLSTDIQDLRALADRNIEDSILSVNSLLTDISNLNNKIVHDLATKRGAADLEDKRDEALKKLSSIIDVQSFARENGAVVVYTTSGATLVDNSAITVTHTALTSVNAMQTAANSDFTGIKVSGVDITADVRLGSMKSAIDLRDKLLPNMQAELDELARNMRDQFNQIHNRGTSYPDMPNKMTGTRTLIEPATSTVKMSAGDTVVTLFDSSGAQYATTTVKTLIGAGAVVVDDGTGVTGVAGALQTWLRAQAGTATATVEVDANGKFAIDLKTTTYGIGFRDEAVVVTGEVIGSGATRQDATVQFNADTGNGAGVDETVSGFANFFGLNDMFVAERTNSTWDSQIMSATDVTGAGGTLDFRISTGSIGTIVIGATDKLSDIATRINANTTLSAVVKATVIPEGGGYRLRLANIAGNEMQVTETTGSATLTNIGLTKSAAGLASLFAVRSEINAAPSKMSRGAVLYNSDTLKYYVSAGDNTTANQLSDLSTTPVSFRVAGDISGTSRTFADHAATFVSLAASATASNQTALEYQKGLHDALTQKSAEISAVNLDEELSKLMMYEHAYAAAAKVISTTQQMLDVLNSLIQ
ncbi:MAG: flagellar hook-associated protein FlgK [Alphaproteobacteria bacterium]|nr:flagellar hook-associated protein FlgK [Alphaproteobacteria bacterium]